MPIFEYKCGDCAKIFEVLQLPGVNKELKCSACGGTNLKKLISAPFLPSSVGKPANDSPSCASCETQPGCPGAGSCGAEVPCGGGAG
ncbi:FmdB family zinc ribbon protein [Pelotomaculum propionicicum]|uniref:Putative regulatory protein FmdB zinc ribbon domain-containing protein n=1 Tax=Pelotomaculum propionicicum TaxID=258475 RepID=A0A4Y7RKQ6_9FIRM|nr:zinc ribbon domain-containing protein [Pelotomaculum propionicicum]NLI13764.1 zinc ribbon domain-containing protein [Peptococcaceae bacterium]TEB09406.1 hypothetical protein Pmgp_03177 [Pelotomaculum propionicicum]